MKTLLLLISLCCTLSLSAKDLNQQETQVLKQELVVMMDKFNKGDTSDISNKTHESLIKLIGGKEKFAQTLMDATKLMKKEGLVFGKVEFGKPSTIYSAGTEEVVFVPRVSILTIQGKKLKSVGYMIAIRKVNSSKWTYLDGSGFAHDQKLLWKLLPNLVKGIKLPENSMSMLTEPKKVVK